MTDRWRELERLFHEALERPDDERDEFVRDACRGDANLEQEVRRLLDAHRTGPNLEPTLPGLLEPGTMIGRFRIERHLASGGMGVVYEARQDNPERQIALKVLRADFSHDEALRRFEEESRLLGRLQHPGIAQIHDAGHTTIEGRRVAYIAMELIREARPVTEDVETRGLDTRGKLALFVRVCDAVQHGHACAVVHRDLKPSNILVGSDGSPRIIDFGVARALDAEARTIATTTGQLVGTVNYMSPEQCAADASSIDARADVYALGVVLFELLCGRLPHPLHGKPLHEAVRIIREDAPTTLSTIDRMLRGDLETIVGKALEKEPERRYADAGELASDIRRHLADEPIIARPPSATYRTRKFVRRHRGLVLATGVVMATLVGALAVSTTLYVQAERARRLAEVEVVRAEQVTHVLESMISGIDPAFAQGEGTALMRLVLEDASKRLETDDLPDDVRASLDAVLGRAWERIAIHDRARTHLDRALAWMEPNLDIGDPDRLRTEGWRAELAIAVGEVEDAERRIDRVLTRQEAVLGLGHTDAIASALVLSRVRYERADLEGMRTLLERTRGAARAVHGDDSVEVAEVETALAGCHFTMQRFDEATPLVTHAIEVLEREHGPTHPATLGARKTRCNGLLQKRAYVEAVDAYGSLIEDAARVFGERHPAVLAMTSNMAFGLQQSGRLDEASSTLRRLVTLQSGSLGPDHPDTVVTMDILAALCNDMRRYEEARDLFERVIPRIVALTSEESVSTLHSRTGLAVASSNLGDLDVADRLFRETLETHLRVVGEEGPTLPYLYLEFATHLARRGENAEAIEIFEALDTLLDDRGIPGEDPYRRMVADSLEKLRS